MSTLDDAALLLQFIRGEVTLAANQNLRVEPAFDSTQLLAKRGGLVATTQSVNSVPRVLVRSNSSYHNLLRHILIEQCFIPIEATEQQEFELYEKKTVPAGYKLNCTEAKALWREWWTSTRHNRSSSIQMNLLIFTRNTWYPVRDIVSSHGTLFISTLATELIFQVTDEVFWLSRSAPEPSSTKLSASQSVPANPVNPSRSAAPLNSVPLPAARSPQPARPRLTDPDDDRMDSMPLRPDLREVLFMRQGRLYIKTPLGEIVVEGANLRYWLNDASVSATVGGH